MTSIDSSIKSNVSWSFVERSLNQRKIFLKKNKNNRLFWFTEHIDILYNNGQYFHIGNVIVLHQQNLHSKWTLSVKKSKLEISRSIFYQISISWSYWVAQKYFHPWLNNSLMGPEALSQNSTQVLCFRKIVFPVPSQNCFALQKELF